MKLSMSETGPLHLAINKTIPLIIPHQRLAISRSTILAVHALQLMISIFLILIIALLLAILHNDVSGAKNSGLDYLRAEQFYHYYVTVLTPITIIFTLGLFPWLAFYPLDNPKWKSGELTDKDIANRIHKFVHNIILQAPQVLYWFWRSLNCCYILKTKKMKYPLTKHLNAGRILRQNVNTSCEI